MYLWEFCKFHANLTILIFSPNLSSIIGKDCRVAVNLSPILYPIYQPVLFLSSSPHLTHPSCHQQYLSLSAEGPTYPLRLISLPSDPLVYPSPSFWRLTSVGNDFSHLRLLLSNPLHLPHLLLWAAGSGSARAFLSHMVNKQTITAPMTIYITVIPVVGITALSIRCLFLFRSIWCMNTQWKTALLNAKTFFFFFYQSKAVIWSIRVALNKDNYVLLYCIDFPIITVKRRCLISSYFSELVILMKGKGLLVQMWENVFGGFPSP